MTGQLAHMLQSSVGKGQEVEAQTLKQELYLSNHITHILNALKRMKARHTHWLQDPLGADVILGVTGPEEEH